MRALEQAAELDRDLDRHAESLGEAARHSGVTLGDGAALVMLEAGQGRDRLVAADGGFVTRRGRERFDIYCAPCHSRLGDGNGMVPQRGYRHPPSYHQERLRKAPLGYFFDVMTNGFGAMPDYAMQITPEDRWKIVAYIRALQLSQNATAADAAGRAIPTAPPRFQEPGSGATPPVPLPETNETGEPENVSGAHQ